MNRIGFILDVLTGGVSGVLLHQDDEKKPRGNLKRWLQILVWIGIKTHHKKMLGWLWDYLWSFLDSLGLSTKSGKILFVGLDNAGKTTLLHLLRDNVLTQPAPTQHPTKEELKVLNVIFQAFDLGGHEEARDTWKDYSVEVSAILFMLDAHDTERITEAKMVLDNFMRIPEAAGAPVAIIANKIDLPNCATEIDLRNYFGLTTTSADDTELNGRKVQLFMCSVKNRQNHTAGIQWLAKHMK